MLVFFPPDRSELYEEEGWRVERKGNIFSSRL